ncbi:MAG: DUF4124 domain-containing protein [Rhodocyclales bacterium GT-UBC]|nr:MAG: DUF4124 domain-containing protein [Rhodocyclales bacterium GT-UBC]
MADLYRIVRPDGRIEYTDHPGVVENLTNGGFKRDEQKRVPLDHNAITSAIKEIQKRIPKLNDYLDYIDYLRHNKPRAFDAVMKELERSDIKTYIALQKHPQFRPLGQTLVGLKAGEKSLALGAGLATGGFTGSKEKWLESTVKDMMKRDNWGPYAKVLGARASTLPAPPAPIYSNSRLGQYLKTDDARAAATSKEAATALEKARAGVRAARGMAAPRVLGPIVDLGLGALDPENASTSGKIALKLKAQKLYELGILDELEWAQTQDLLSQEKYVEMQKLITEAINRYTTEGRQ